MNPIGLKKVQVKMRCVQKYTYRAMTLPELLVVMIVGGIVFLMVFEAWNMASVPGGRLSGCVIRGRGRLYTRFAGHVVPKCR